MRKRIIIAPLRCTFHEPLSDVFVLYNSDLWERISENSTEAIHFTILIIAKRRRRLHQFGQHAYQTNAAHMRKKNRTEDIHKKQ